MTHTVISGTGAYLPPDSISNEELVESYNQHVKNANSSQGLWSSYEQCLDESDAEFILKASGIKNRHVIDKKGILNQDIMHPIITKRNNDEMSLQCEISIKAARIALKNANKTPEEVDAVIVSCSNFQRAYPALSIEVQSALKIKGFAFDMNVACSSASFGIVLANSMIKSGLSTCVLVITPEMYTGHLNFRDRRSHFIFGDGCSAIVLEKEKTCQAEHSYRIISEKLKTKFSNSIRNNFGFLNRSEKNLSHCNENLFVQNGKQVRKDVVPMVIDHLQQHLATHQIKTEEIKRLWLHQANIHMINAIAHGVLNRHHTEAKVPTILSEYGNTGASSVAITFNKFHQDLRSGDKGIICSFGAGYAVGSILVEKI